MRYTGIPFTSEKIINQNDFFKGKSYNLIHDINMIETEISSTIFWEAFQNFKIPQLIWNIYPFHPHKKGNMLTNRAPTSEELVCGGKILNDLLNIFSIKKIIAVGKKPEAQLKKMDIDCEYIRHPANGGSKEFLLKMNNYNKTPAGNKSTY